MKINNQQEFSVMSRGHHSFVLPVHIHNTITFNYCRSIVCWSWKSFCVQMKRTFPFVDDRLHPISYLYYNLKRRSLSHSPPPPLTISSLPLIYMYAYIFYSSQSPIRYTYTHIYTYRRSIIIAQVKMRWNYSYCSNIIYICM